MKVMHYVGSFSLPSETFIYDLIKNLDENGIINHVLTHERQLEEERPYNKVKIVPKEVSLLKKIHHRLFKRWDIYNSSKVKGFLIEYKPDVIHAHFGPNGVRIFKLIEKERLNIKLVVSFHGTDTTMYPLRFTSYRKSVQEMLLSEKVLLTFPSLFLKKEFQKNFSVDDRNNQIILPNSFNNAFKQVVKNKRIEDQPVRLISVGRLINFKGFEVLIKAFAIINKKLENSYLTIIGSGSQEQYLRKLINKHGLQNKITLAGTVTHSDVRRMILESDIYIQPSIVDKNTNQTESFGVAVIEAIVTGLPVIVTNVGGLPETVLGGDDKFAKIVDPNNPIQICNAVLELSTVKEDNITFREKIISSFSQESQFKNVLNIYNNH